MTALLSKTNELMELWAALIPIFCPEQSLFNLWVVKYGNLVEWGIKETAQKYQKKHGNMDSDYLVKFMSVILRAEASRHNSTAGIQT